MPLDGWHGIEADPRMTHTCLVVAKQPVQGNSTGHLQTMSGVPWLALVCTMAPPPPEPRPLPPGPWPLPWLLPLDPCACLPPWATDTSKDAFIAQKSLQVGRSLNHAFAALKSDIAAFDCAACKTPVAQTSLNEGHEHWSTSKN